MKAAAFNYARAASIEEAVALLVRNGERAKLLAGGQSLLPALNLRLMSLDLLVDISGIAALRGIRIEGGSVRIGALTRHADLLAVARDRRPCAAARQAVAHVAHPAIRNRGTIGGNLAHADPASELPACMQALGANMVLRGPSGERRVDAADFFMGLYQTALAPDEMLVAVEFPAIQRGERAFFHEFARRRGDYAIIGLAAQAKLAGDRIEALRLAYFGVGDRATPLPRRRAASSATVCARLARRSAGRARAGSSAAERSSGVRRDAPASGARAAGALRPGTCLADPPSRRRPRA